VIAGRPTNLWLGLTTALTGAIAATLIALGFDAVVVGTLAGVWTGVLGAGIALIAGKAPTLQAGDTYTIVTPKGQPNYEATVPRPPAGGPPPEPIAEVDG
jgi:hypothetical protein